MRKIKKIKCPKCNKEMIHHEAGSRKNIEAAGGQIVRWGEIYYCPKCSQAYNKNGRRIDEKIQKR